MFVDVASIVTARYLGAKARVGAAMCAGPVFSFDLECLLVEAGGKCVCVRACGIGRKLV